MISAWKKGSVTQLRGGDFFEPTEVPMSILTRGNAASNSRTMTCKNHVENIKHFWTPGSSTYLSPLHIDVRVVNINICRFYYQRELWPFYPRSGTLGSGIRLIHRKLKLNDMR